MKTSSISYRVVLGSNYRFDPSYHLSEATRVRKVIHALPYGTTIVSDCANSVFIGNIFSRVFVKDLAHGIPYLAASDTVLSNLDTGLFLSRKQASDLSYLMLKKDWILVTCSGTLGNVTYTNRIFEGRIATHDLIRIVPSDKEVLRGCLYAFLSSKYGYFQLTQSSFGGVVKHINADHAGSILVPRFPEEFQKTVDSLIKDSSYMREEANDCLNKAKLLLGNYLNVSFSNTGFKTSRVNIKDVLGSLQERLDPPAHINNGVCIMSNLIAKKPYKRIGDIDAIVHRPGIFKRCYVEDGIPYIKGSEIFMTNPFHRCEHLSRTKTPYVDEMTLTEGQILITCAGSVGNIKMITKEYQDKEAIGSQDIIRLVSHDELFTKEYLFTYLQMPFVYDYIQSMKYGSVIERIEPFHVESIPVIEPSEEISQQVTELIQKYMDYTYRAYIAEETAISMVENEIEN